MEGFEVIVVGSGAGGGVVAGELADAGVSVLLLEAGPYRTAADFMRWEAHASHHLYFPVAFAEPPADAPGPPLAMLRGRCVGGTTTINTKVALRPPAQDYEKWHAAGGLLGADGGPFSESDLLPFIERVERRLGVRERADWQQCVRTVAGAFEQLGAPLEPVVSYTDPNCMLCGSCLQGCPTNAGKSTQNTWIQPAVVAGSLALQPGCTVTRVMVEDDGDAPRAVGVEYVDADGHVVQARAEVVVLAAGALATSQLLLRSGVGAVAGGSASSRLIGRHLGFHVARLVEGLFDEVQDAHMVYPISAHSMGHQLDEDGGFVVEASTIQDPIGFATALCDENDVPLWGRELTDAVSRYRCFTGLLTMVNDENTGTAWIDEDGADRYSYAWTDTERRRIDESLAFAREVLYTAGARQVYQTAPLSTHLQGGCRMGSDPGRSVVDAHGESHDIRRLFVGDSSVIPRTLSVNPSLTIMSLACRLAAYLAGGEHGYFGAPRVGAASPGV